MRDPKLEPLNQITTEFLFVVVLFFRFVFVELLGLFCFLSQGHAM
jgi:hypothetical protein